MSRPQLRLSPPRHQRGVALIVSLVLLVVALGLVLSLWTSVRATADITSNAQQRDQAQAAAEQTVEAAVNSPLLTTSPTTVFTSPCGQPNTLCYDANSDGTADVAAVLTPTPSCVKASAVPLARLEVSKQADELCVVQQGQSFGVAAAANSNSVCASTVWNVRAVATDSTTGATATVAQGIGVRVRTQDMGSSCP